MVKYIWWCCHNGWSQCPLGFQFLDAKQSTSLTLTGMPWMVPATPTVISIWHTRDFVVVVVAGVFNQAPCANAQMHNERSRDICELYFSVWADCSPKTWLILTVDPSPCCPLATCSAVSGAQQPDPATAFPLKITHLETLRNPPPTHKSTLLPLTHKHTHAHALSTIC